MMMRRYQDAIRTLSNILLFIQRTKQHFQNKTYLYDQVGIERILYRFCKEVSFKLVMRPPAGWV